MTAPDETQMLHCRDCQHRLGSGCGCEYCAWVADAFAAAHRATGGLRMMRHSPAELVEMGIVAALPVIRVAAVAAERAKFVCMKPIKGIYGADTWCQRRIDHPGDCQPVTPPSDWQSPHEAVAAERERSHARALEALKRFEGTAAAAQAKAVGMAVAAERERCAALAEQHGATCPSGGCGCPEHRKPFADLLRGGGDG